MTTDNAMADDGGPASTGTGRAAARPGRSHTTGMAYFAEFLRLRCRYETRPGGAAPGRSDDDDDRLAFDRWHEETEAGLATRLDHLGFARWLAARCGSMAPGAWRRTRAAALEGLRIEGLASSREAEALLRAARPVDGAWAIGDGSAKPRTAGDGEVALVLSALDRRAERGSRVAKVAAHWLRAGRVVPLPLHRWQGARLLPADDAGGPYLGVPERTRGAVGDAHGFRTVDLAGFAPADLASVRALADAVREAGPADFCRLRRSCSELLSRVGAEVWPGKARKSVTPQTVRLRRDGRAPNPAPRRCGAAAEPRPTRASRPRRGAARGPAHGGPGGR